MNDLKFICVSGFFASGSSAVVDLLKEINNFYECNAEIRIIKDPYGIIQLENALVWNWELINSTAAISDFLNLCKICGRRNRTPLSRAGMGYADTINKNFLGLIEEYIDKLTDYKYKSEFYYHKFKKRYFKYVIDRCRWGVEHVTKGKLKTANRNIPYCYFSHPTQECFNEATKELFSKLFTEQKNEGFTHIILDQAVSPNNPDVIHRYFKQAKMIIVDRDPRDMFIDDLLYGVNYDDDYYSRQAGIKYAKRQKELRKALPCNDADVLYVRFEDLILNYKTTINQIFSFLKISDSDYVYSGKFLKPEVSKKNIGIWKSKYEECKEALDAISEYLPEYCYEIKSN